MLPQAYGILAVQSIRSTRPGSAKPLPAWKPFQQVAPHKRRLACQKMKLFWMVLFTVGLLQVSLLSWWEANSSLLCKFTICRQPQVG